MLDQACRIVPHPTKPGCHRLLFHRWMNSETLHLMSSSENEQRLNHAAAQIETEIIRRRAV